MKKKGAKKRAGAAERVAAAKKAEAKEEKNSAKEKDALKREDGATKDDGAKKQDGAKKPDDAKKDGAVKRDDGASLSDKLKSLTDGLSYQSESDYAVEPYVRASGEGAPTAEEFAKGREGDDAAVRGLDFDSFFGNYTSEQDWWGEEERATAGKFQALVAFLKGNLTDVKVYRVGDVEADVYVVGKTSSGEYAGVKTKIVET